MARHSLWATARNRVFYIHWVKHCNFSFCNFFIILYVLSSPPFFFYLESALHYLFSCWCEFLPFDSVWAFLYSSVLPVITTLTYIPRILLYLSICPATPLLCRASIADLSKNILNVLLFQFNFLLAPQQQNLIESRCRLSVHNDSISNTWLPLSPDHT